MSKPTPGERRSGLFLVGVVLVVVVAVLLVLARIVPGPMGLRVTVIETGRVGTSRASTPMDLP